MGYIRGRAINNSAGQSLVQVLIAVGIMGTVFAGLTTLIANQQRESRALAEKLGSLDLARVVTQSLSQPSTCNLLITKPGNVATGSNLTFNPGTVTYPFLINLQAVPQSATSDIVSLASGMASDLSTTLKLRPTTGIQVEVTSATAGNLLINFDQTGLVRPLKNLSFPISIATTVVGANRQIVGCQNAAGSGGGSCPADQLMTGINPDGTPICTSQGSQLGAPCTVSWGGTDPDTMAPVTYTIRGVTSNVLNSTQRCCMGGWVNVTGSGGAGCVVF